MKRARVHLLEMLREVEGHFEFIQWPIPSGKRRNLPQELLSLGHQESTTAKGRAGRWGKLDLWWFNLAPGNKPLQKGPYHGAFNKIPFDTKASVSLREDTDPSFHPPSLIHLFWENSQGIIHVVDPFKAKAFFVLVIYRVGHTYLPEPQCRVCRVESGTGLELKIWLLRLLLSS